MIWNASFSTKTSEKLIPEKMNKKPLIKIAVIWPLLSHIFFKGRDKKTLYFFLFTPP